MYTKEDIEFFKEKKEWLRVTEVFSKDQLAEIANMSSKYLGKTIGCIGCGSAYRDTKFALVNHFCQIIQNYRDGLYDIKEESILEEREKEVQEYVAEDNKELIEDEEHTEDAIQEHTEQNTEKTYTEFVEEEKVAQPKPQNRNKTSLNKKRRKK